MLTDDELLELLRGGESDRVEFTSECESAGEDDKIRRAMCARLPTTSPDMASRALLFIGVNDDGSCADIPG